MAVLSKVIDFLAFWRKPEPTFSEQIIDWLRYMFENFRGYIFNRHIILYYPLAVVAFFSYLAIRKQFRNAEINRRLEAAVKARSDEIFREREIALQQDKPVDSQSHPESRKRNCNEAVLASARKLAKQNLQPASPTNAGPAVVQPKVVSKPRSKQAQNTIAVPVSTSVRSNGNNPTGSRQTTSRRSVAQPKKSSPKRTDTSSISQPTATNRSGGGIQTRSGKIYPQVPKK